MDGTRLRYTETKKCVSCTNYRVAIECGLADGVDNSNGANNKSSRSFSHEWSEEERQAHRLAIKRGIERSKLKKGEKDK